MIFRIVREQAEAEEILQDVFLQLWRHAWKYNEQRGGLLSWLLVMARSRALDHLRARSGRSLRRDETQQELTDYNLPVYEPSKEEALIAAEKAEIIREALGSLPDVQRYAIELAYFEGLSQSEIAERLAEPLGTVKTRIRSGMMKLKEALAPHFTKTGK